MLLRSPSLVCCVVEGVVYIFWRHYPSTLRFTEISLYFRTRRVINGYLVTDETISASAFTIILLIPDWYQYLVYKTSHALMYVLATTARSCHP
jgi:hypothetical protein